MHQLHTRLIEKRPALTPGVMTFCLGIGFFEDVKDDADHHDPFGQADDRAKQLVQPSHGYDVDQSFQHFADQVNDQHYDQENGYVSDNPGSVFFKGEIFFDKILDITGEIIGGNNPQDYPDEGS